MTPTYFKGPFYFYYTSNEVAVFLHFLPIIVIYGNPNCLKANYWEIIPGG